MIDFEKSEKLPKDRRYFNISIIWIFYFRYVIRPLYWLRIPHEAVTLLSIFFGIGAAYLFFTGSLIAAAVALHLKDLFDACDGAIARLTGRGHLIGRYLDSLGDFLSLTLVMLAIGFRAADNMGGTYILWAVAAILSTFLQCSFFNYYQLSYLDAFGIMTLSSKRDETTRDDVKRKSNSFPARGILILLRFFYIIVYSWQDGLTAFLDSILVGKNKTITPELRFGNRLLMVLQSALCFGTHIFIIIIWALLGRPEAALIFITIVMNLYLFLLLYLRKRHYRRQPVEMSFSQSPKK
ncbi:MAG: CDP-alcohol phosphatidyltransferase family protein [Candidatus Zixiibacteriota bacterium]